MEEEDFANELNENVNSQNIMPKEEDDNMKMNPKDRSRKPKYDQNNQNS